MIFLDASAAAKRYFPERGSDKVSEVLSGPERHFSLALLPCELASGLNRRLREGDLSQAVYRTAKEQIRVDVSLTELVPVDADLIGTSLRLLDTHPLKTLDSLYLAGAVRLQQSLRERVLFVSADRQLLTAARAEGLRVLDPERP